jgi:glycosyltransferase involved in cell wall biosynthesis
MQQAPLHSEKPPRRVLHILNDLRFSGAEVMLTQAAPYWHEAGLELAVLACGPEVGPYAPALEAAGYRIEHLPFRKSLRDMARLRKTLDRLHPDLIHVHSEGMAFFIALANQASIHRPTLRTVHSNFPFSGVLQQRKRLERALQRAWGTWHVAIGPSVAENEKIRFWNRCLTCPNWFDSFHYRPPTQEEVTQARAQWGIPSGQIALVTVGNCNATKNHEALLQALATGPLRDGPWMYLHAGQEEPGTPERSLAHALGLASQVRYLGAVQDIRSLLWAADLYVMPSLYEGFGNAALEAAGTGIPMLLPRVPGLRDFEGYDWPRSITWSDYPTAPSLALALKQWLAHPSPKDSRPWVGQFSIQSGACRYLDVYGQILQDA